MMSLLRSGRAPRRDSVCSTRSIDGIFGGHYLGAHGTQFLESALTFGGIQGRDRIFDNRNAAFTLEQALSGQANANFGYHAKNENFSIGIQAADQAVSVVGLKNIEGFFFEQNLLLGV